MNRMLENALRMAILNTEDAMKYPSRKLIADVAMELREVADLADVKNAHEWIYLHKKMACIFLSTTDKRDWLLRRLPQFRSENLFR